MSRSDGKGGPAAAQAAFFDGRADAWEETCYPPPVRERLEALIPEFGVRPGERVLDMGTGPGVLIPYLRERIGPEGRLWAMDISFRMIQQARRKTTGARDLALQADAHRLPFTSGVFDRIVCFAAFPHFHDPAAALGEMARVVRTGGAVIVAHLMSRKELAAHHGGHSAVARDVLPDAARMNALFTAADLSPPEIADAPGRYLARASKVAGG